MTEYILRLIGEGKPYPDALELRVNGELPKQGDRLTIEKEYPACIVTYKVEGVSPMNIKIPKDPLPIYQADMPIVSALREEFKPK